MKIAVDISPISKNSNSLHRVRGVGKYIELLTENLEKFDTQNKYIFISFPKEIDSTVDIIHYPYFDPFFVTLPFKKSIRTVVTVHDLIPIAHKKEFVVGIKGMIKWRLNKARLRRSDAIITDSVASKEDVVDLVKIPKDKIFPVHLAVDEDFKVRNILADEKKKLLTKYSLPEKFVLYVGDVTWNKNLPRIIKAVLKANVVLVMVGKALSEIEFDKNNIWNKDRLEVLALTQNNPLFVKLGYVPTDDLVKIYNIAQLLLLPSLDEGFGLPVLEAMKSGCPVITSKNGSLSEVGQEAVMYVNPEDVDEINLGIRKVLGDHSFAKKLIDAGVMQGEKFSLKKMINDTVAVYSSLNIQ